MQNNNSTPTRVIKHPMPTLEECKQNIRNKYLECTDQEIEAWKDWYVQEHEWAMELSACTGYDLLTVAAVAAALSPRIHWGLAKLAAEDLMHDQRVSVSQVIRKNLDKAQSCKHGDLDALRGPKVVPFSELLINPALPDRVVIDSWAIQGALNRVVPAKQLSNYASNQARLKTMRQAYTEVAEEYGMLPCQMQAIVWCKLNPEYNVEDE